MSSAKIRRPSGTSAMPARAMSSGAPAAQRAPAQPNVPAGDRRDAHDRVQRRRLAGAVRADQADDLARRDLERKAAHRVHAAVADVEIVDDEAVTLLGSFLGHRRLAEVGGSDVEVRADLRGRSLGQRRALVEHADAIADLHDQRHVVVDQEDAGLVLAPDRAHHRREVGHLRLRQPGGGLVEQQEPRLGRESPGDSEPPLVAVAEGVAGPSA